MKHLIPELTAYLKETLNVATTPIKTKDEKKLPLFLREMYTLFECTILDARCVLIIPENTTELSPANIRKHTEQIHTLLGSEPVYVTDAVTAYNRKRLILQKVPFIIPGNQLYLPFLALDLREYFYNRKPASLDKLSPTAQVLLLKLIYENSAHAWSSVELAKDLGYSTMTILRIFNELEKFDMGLTITKGRPRILEARATGNELWKKVFQYLQTPILHTYYIASNFFTSFEMKKLLVTAGISALSRDTMIAEGPNQIYAISQKIWQQLKKNKTFEILQKPDTEIYEIQVWKYDPLLVSVNNIADPLSLFLSLRDLPDERIQDSLTELLEKIKW